MTEREKMVAGELYCADDPELRALHGRACRLSARLNGVPMDATEEREAVIRELFGKCGKNVFIARGFECDYGMNIEVGDNFFVNYGVVILDVCKVSIGDNCLIAPQAGIYTACHPLERETRVSRLELGKPIVIGNDCWIGGRAVITPGVTLGDNVVVGAGAVVTRSFPSDVVIAGNPARIIRYLGKTDFRPGI